jgi:hypothetical protein
VTLSYLLRVGLSGKRKQFLARKKTYKIFFSGLDDKVSRLEFELAASNELIIQLRNG